jgi:hypothetical protein
MKLCHSKLSIKSETNQDNCELDDRNEALPSRAKSVPGNDLLSRISNKLCLSYQVYQK